MQLQVPILSVLLLCLTGTILATPTHPEHALAVRQIGAGSEDLCNYFVNHAVTTEDLICKDMTGGTNQAYVTCSSLVKTAGDWAKRNFCKAASIIDALSEALHLVLQGMAWIVRYGNVPAPVPFNMPWGQAALSTSELQAYLQTAETVTRGQACDGNTAGFMYCASEGTFMTCDHSNWVPRLCGDGTRCQPNGDNYIVCGW